MNKSALNKVVIFAAGAAIGSAVTWKLIKTRYERITNEAIESVKEVFGRGKHAESQPVDDTDTEKDKAELTDILQNQSYTNYTKQEKGYAGTMDAKKPYVIAPEEFGEYDGYEIVSLTYYADGILTDEEDDAIEDIESIVGADSLNHFGEYEDDSVFVRNDARKTDYEILLDTREYANIIHDYYPRLVEDE